jgi:tape measure domain-containing protein
MSNEATILRIRAQVENLEGLNRARSAVRNFATESKAASNDLDKLRSLFKELGSESVRSVNNLKNYRTGLDALRQSAEIGSTTFKELTSEIRQLDTELGSLQGKQTQVAQGFNKITTATNSAIAAQRTYSGLIRNPLTGGYSMPPVQVPMGGRLLPAAQGFDFAAQDSRIQAQVAEASAQSARDARRRAKMQELANYSGTTIGARDPNTGALIAGGYGPFQNVGTQYNRPAGPQPAPIRARTNFGAAASGLGAVASGAVFGGPEGAGGALIGLGLGGPAGAFAGATIGATVGAIRQAIGETGKYTAELQLLRIALGGVSTSSKDYENNLQAVNRLSQRFLIPLKDTTQQYTKLQASVQGAGLGSKQTETAFKGIAAAIIATGGSAQDLNSALTATSQVFSKGKVSAEELRGQIGERLAGAFTIFAASIGKTPQQLDKALKDGEVTLANFLTFTEELFKRYGKTADIIAEAPQNAGKRLTLALDNITIQIGRFAGPIGAAFQSIAANIVNGLAPAFEAFANLLDLPKTAAKERLPQIDRQIKAAQKQIDTYRLGEGMPGGRLAFTIPRQLQETQLKALQGERKLIEVTLASVGSGVNRNTARPGDMVGGGDTKTAENAVKRLQEKRKEQLAEAKQLLKVANDSLEVATSTNEREKLSAEYAKTKTEIAGKYDKKIRESVSKEASGILNQAKSVELEAAKQKYGIDRLKLMENETKELYAQVGLSATLNKNLQAALAGAFTGGTATGTFRTDVDLMPGLTGGKLGSRMEELRKELETLNDPINQIIVGAESIGAAFTESFTGIINGSMSAQESLANFFKNIANYFLDMAGKMIAKYIEMQIIGLAKQFLPGMFGGIFGPGGAPNYSGSSVSVPNQYAYGGGASIMGSANGNVFAQNGIVPFANGGIVDRPMMFPFAKGIGLMGEAGPEAIMPLKRGADGKLGVAGGGGGTSVTVNVDASGSSVQGNNGQSAALGRAIAASVQAELVKQKRPGGLLA